jgi:hypothetical protein
MMDAQATAAALRAMADQIDPPADAAPPAKMHPGTSIPWVTGNFSIDVTVAFAGGHRSPDTPARDAALAAWDQREQTAYHTGNYALDDAVVNDEAAKAYIGAMMVPYFAATGHDLRFDGLIGGQKYKLDAYFAEARQLSYDKPHLVAAYDGPVKAMLAQMMGD